MTGYDRDVLRALESQAEALRNIGRVLERVATSLEVLTEQGVPSQSATYLPPPSPAVQAAKALAEEVVVLKQLIRDITSYSCGAPQLFLDKARELTA